MLETENERSILAVSRSASSEVSLPPLAVTELVLVAGFASVIGIGWVALVLAQLGRLTRTNLLLAPAVITVMAVALSLIRRRASCTPHGVWEKPVFSEKTGFCSNKSRPHSNQNPQSRSELCRRIRVRHFTGHDAALAGLLLVAAVLYTPPADYAPALLDAGWYSNAGALIARTGSLTTRPSALEDLPAADRNLFVRTYRDVSLSLPNFPSRYDLGFYDLVFAIDLGRQGPVVPYHPPLASIWIAVLRLLGGPEAGGYAAPLFGLLFVLAVFTAGRAIFGPNVGLVGALLTALSPAVVYYARTPYAELLAATLIWIGVYAMSRLTKMDTSPTHVALLAGLAFGAALLAKVESILLLPAIAAFWTIGLRRRWVTRREFAVFLLPFGTLLGHTVVLYVTVLRPYIALNGYGVWSLVTAALSRPAVWAAVTGVYVGGIVALLVRRRSRRPEVPSAIQRRKTAKVVTTNSNVDLLSLSRSKFVVTTSVVQGETTTKVVTTSQNVDLLSLSRSKFVVTTSVVQGETTTKVVTTNSNVDLVSLVILATAGATLLFAWPATQANSHAGWSSLTELSLFLTPLGLCLGIVGLSVMVADELNRHTSFFVLVLSTAGLAAVLMPAVSSNVSYLYTIRRQLPVVVPALSLLTAYVTLRWAGLAQGNPATPPHWAGLRRGLALLLLTLVLLSFLEVGRPLVQEQELAGSSQFVAELAGVFDPDDIVLFESEDRGAHVGRFAAPLWARYGVTAMLLSSSYPPPEHLAQVLRRWHEEGRRVFFVSQSNSPPLALPDFRWQLVSRQHWAGSTIAARMSFPPETWLLEVPFYIWRIADGI